MTDHQPKQEWEDTAFEWSSMQEGIFDKILEEDPHFFKRKRNRPMPVWFFLGLVALLLCGFGYHWLVADKGSHMSPEQPTVRPINDDKQPIVTTYRQLEDGLQKKALIARTDQPIKPSRKVASTSFLTKNKAGVIQSATKHKAVIVAKITGADPSDKTPNERIYKQKKHSKLTVPLLAIATTPLLTIKPSTQRLPVAVIPLIHDVENNIDNNKHEKKPWRIATTSGLLFSFSKYSGNAEAVALRNGHTSPIFGYQYGLDVQMPLFKNNFLLLGLSNQVAYQNIDINTERRITVPKNGILLGVTQYVIGGRISNTYGDTIVGATEKNRLVNYNEFKSVQITVGFTKKITRKNWSISPSAGIVASLFNQSKGMTVASDQSILVFNSDNPIFSRFQFRASAGIEVERQLSKKMSLLVRYQFDKQWNNSSLESGMIFRPSYHYLSLGAAISL